MASAAAAAVKVTTHPPSSPFAALLHQSKFASYDPAIRQVYSSPPASSYRGDWGLKRPLPLRRRNAFISAKSVDSRAQQTEWNHGEAQVRFIRRWEEIGTMARPKAGASNGWDKKLGKAKVEWEVDSEFAPAPPRVPAKEREVDDLGKGLGGKGYVTRMRQAQESYISPNINAMSKREFERYLNKLRELRPQFLAHIQSHAKTTPGIEGQSPYALAQNLETPYHREFVAAHTERTFNDMSSRVIEQQPHPTGGLLYSHPTALETYFRTKPQPGFVLQKIAERSGRMHSRRQEDGYVASFAGIASTLKRRNAGGKVPLLDLASEKGVERERVGESVAHMRVAPNPSLVDAPKVVGMQGQGLKGAWMTVEVQTEDGTDFGRENPYTPGGREYVAMEPLEERRSGSSKLKVPRAPAMRPILVTSAQRLGIQQNEEVLDRLRGIIGQPGGNEDLGDNL